MSEQPSIHAALSAVMEEVRAVAKTSRNNQGGYDFRGIDAVVNAAGPVIRKHKVVPMPMLLEHAYETVEVGQKRTPMEFARVKVRYRFVGPAGDHLDAEVPGAAMDSGDKAVSKAMSVAYRIALLQVLCLPTDERDPDADSYERSPRSQAALVDPVSEARKRLAAVCEEKGIAPADAAKRYLETTKTDLRQETDPEVIDAFAETLEAA